MTDQPSPRRRSSTSDLAYQVAQLATRMDMLMTQVSDLQRARQQHDSNIDARVSHIETSFAELTVSLAHLTASVDKLSAKIDAPNPDAVRWSWLGPMVAGVMVGVLGQLLLWLLTGFAR